MPTASAEQTTAGAPTRSPADADHVAFAPGIHLCLGAHPARLEAGVMSTKLIERVERFEVDGEIVRGKNPSIRGIKRLPVLVTLR